MKRLHIFLSCLVVCFFIGGISAKADGFDATYYAAKYPDVVNGLGTDPTVLYNHYISFGVNEGRFQNAQEEYLAFTNQAEPVNVAAEPAPNLYPTYVDVNLATQMVNYYENGELKLSTPCVTGNTSLGRGTPCGTYSINAEVPGKFLTGPTWNVWVDRWMPFNGDIGLHDASWRSSFGGDIYQTNGSHGCVNLPHDAALALFDMAKIGTTVVVH